MKILFIRHGNPNYQLDCLTELGHIQAEAAAEALCTMGIDEIFSSSKGRAVQTAEYTARKLSMPITQCDFMREISWSQKDKSDPIANGHPWTLAFEYVKENLPLNDPDWRNNESFSKTVTPDCFATVARGLDEWLAALGFVREGNYYRTGEVKRDTVAMFCHGGSYAVTISHLFNIPFPMTLLYFPLQQTGISVVEFKGTVGELTHPCFLSAGNVEHLINKGIEVT